MTVQAIDKAKFRTAEPLLRSQEDGIALLELNRPASRNTLSEAMTDALQGALDDIASDKRIRAVILAANGPAFCAGHDLKEMMAHRQDADGGRAYYEDVFARCSKLMGAVINLRQPVIAAVEGVATAAGCQLVATCDLAFAASTARFATSGINVGLFCSTPSVALARNVSRKHAMEMLLTGNMISAEEATRIGLINRVIAPPESVRQAAFEVARLIASKSPVAVALGKRAFYGQVQMPLDEAYSYTSNLMVENMLAQDAEEGIKAFIEKRSPRWSGPS
jgi:enoyl-CoA hydratase/carnithine racemase